VRFVEAAILKVLKIFLNKLLSSVGVREAVEKFFVQVKPSQLFFQRKLQEILDYLAGKKVTALLASCFLGLKGPFASVAVVSQDRWLPDDQTESK